MLNFRAPTCALNFPNTSVVAVDGTQGIGGGIAAQFVESGASVLVVGRKEKRLETRRPRRWRLFHTTTGGRLLK